MLYFGEVNLKIPPKLVQIHNNTFLTILRKPH